MFFRPALACAALVAASACADMPADPEGTLERVRIEKRFRVGIASPGADRPDLDRQEALIGRIARATGAEPQVTAGASERLLGQLEQGGIDLVLGEFAGDSPWRTRVTMLPPLEERHGTSGAARLTAAARNGENAWIGLLYREGRKAGGAGG